jgi:hypothetical protein
MEEWFVHHDYVRCMKAEWYSLAPGISMLPKDNGPAFTDAQFLRGIWGGQDGSAKTASGLGRL